MYLSHKYKFLFLRTPKTASSSLSDFFIRNIDDPDAIYTEVEDSGLPGTLDERIVSRYRPYAFYHFSLQQLIAEGIITEEQAHNYYCFALLRNPIDRAKSFYYFYKKWRTPNKPASLKEYKSWTNNGVFDNDANSGIVQTDLLKFKDKMYGTYWLYEDLHIRLPMFMANIGVEIKHELPRHKTDTRKTKKNEIQFDNAAKNDIINYFKADWEMYNSKCPYPEDMRTDR